MKESDEVHNQRLTGNYYFKPSFFGLYLVLLVEIEHTWGTPEKGITETKREFVRGSLEDAFNLKLATCNRMINV